MRPRWKRQSLWCLDSFVAAFQYSDDVAFSLEVWPILSGAGWHWTAAEYSAATDEIKQSRSGVSGSRWPRDAAAAAAEAALEMVHLYSSHRSMAFRSQWIRS
jgi:hypothetical protein